MSGFLHFIRQFIKPSPISKHQDDEKKSKRSERRHSPSRSRSRSKKRSLTIPYRVDRQSLEVLRKNRRASVVPHRDPMGEDERVFESGWDETCEPVMSLSPRVIAVRTYFHQRKPHYITEEERIWCGTHDS